ncbi:MAG: hypothetical protein ACW981_09355 [Candidatus Hodarchaeales archaeon]|jgi:hypothetical protein
MDIKIKYNFTVKIEKERENMINIKKGLRQKKGVHLGFLLIFLTLFTFPGSAVDFSFKEDFNGPMDNWTLQGTDWKSNGIVSINHTFSISSGELISGGASDRSKLNGAYIKDNTSVGGWSIDVLVPTSAKTHLPTDRIWGLLFSEIKMSKYENQPNSTKYPEFGINFRKLSCSFYAFAGTPEILLDELILLSMQKFDQKQHYDFIRTTERFYVFIDNEMALNTSFSSTIGSSINYFTISVAQGSNVTFDNLSITNDADELLNDLLSNSPSSNVSGFSIFSIFLIGTLSIILIRKRKESKF